MIQLLLKYPAETPSTRGYELLKTTLDLHGIPYTESCELTVDAGLVITDLFLHESPIGDQIAESQRLIEIANSCQARGIPLLWYYPGESWYTEAVVYNPTARFAATLTVPTYLIKSGDATSLGDLAGFTKVLNLEQYHIYQVLNKFNLARLYSTRNKMIDTIKDRKFLYLNGMARDHRQLIYNEIRDRDLLSRSIWSWKDLKQGLDTSGYDPESNWDSDRLMINQFRYQCFYPEHYARTEFSLVVETAQGEHFVSEKTAKCLILGHPFVVVGNQNFLPKLHEWGYKTFDGVIDESYDKYHIYHGKPKVVADEVARLCSMSNVFDACIEQTEHNMRHSLYLAMKIYSDLLTMIIESANGSISENQNLPKLPNGIVRQYMTDFM